MKRSVHLAGVSGSIRRESFNTRLLNVAGEQLPVNTTMSILQISDIPLYNADLDLPAAKERPGPVVRFREELERADGVVIVSPEYNYSIPGVLKNALDWASRGNYSPLLGKPVALFGATPGKGGTIRMQAAFAPVFLFLGMKQILKPEIIISEVNNKFEGDLLTDDKIWENIRKKLEALVEEILLRENRQA